MPDNAFAKWLRARLGPKGVVVMTILLWGPAMALVAAALDGVISLITGEFAPTFQRDVPTILGTLGLVVVLSEAYRLDRNGSRPWLYWLASFAFSVGISQSILRIAPLWHLLTDGMAASAGNLAMGIVRVGVAGMPVAAAGFAISRLIVPRSRRQQPDRLSPA